MTRRIRKTVRKIHNTTNEHPVTINNILYESRELMLLGHKEIYLLKNKRLYDVALFTTADWSGYTDILQPFKMWDMWAMDNPGTISEDIGKALGSSKDCKGCRYYAVIIGVIGIYFILPSMLMSLLFVLACLITDVLYGLIYDPFRMHKKQKGDKIKAQIMEIINIRKTSGN